MSHSRSMVIAPSSDFIALCQAQISLLTQWFKADWSAVYLTEEAIEGMETHLFPVAIYPQADTDWERETRAIDLPDVLNQVTSTVPLLSGVSLAESDPSKQDTAIKSYQTIWEMPSSKGHHKMVFPLIDEETVMGLLVTGRKDRQWNKKELNQIEKVANTLALACGMERRQNWYQQQLERQNKIRRLERDRLDSLLHQLRNPLTALRTFGKLLLKRLLPDDRNQSVVQGILRESDRLQELLKEFETDIEVTHDVGETLTLDTKALYLPEATSAHLLGDSLSLEAIAVNEILEPLVVSGSAIATERGISLFTKLPTHLTFIQGDRRALREIFSNLIDNALKYTPAGGTVQIEAGLERVDNIAHWQGIAISDTGYGIPSEDRDRIFERHYRGVQAKGDIPGTGLGLAIVKELIEQMQGKIELISPNQLSLDKNFPGTTFIVWLITDSKEPKTE
jgi:signal transduction histidine kinase